MNDAGALLIESTQRLLEARCDEATVRSARDGAWLGELWAAIEEQGLPLALVPENAGGFGLPPSEALELVRLLGRYAVPLPVGETMIANAALAASGLPLAEGPAALVTVGESERVAWGRNARTLVVERHGALTRLTQGWSVVREGTNLAGLPRDTLSLPDGGEQAPYDGPPLLLLGGLVRTLEIAGALERVLELTAAHVSERVQFGRALAGFQVIQHELAKLAGESAAASAAADFAVDTYVAGGDLAFAVGVARVRVGEAVGKAIGIAHQLHGAIGFTVEHRLHLLTTSLWGWRDEFGGAAKWSALVGDRALAAGREGFWSMVTKA